jgi:signal transduction histidine kinase
MSVVSTLRPLVTRGRLARFVGEVVGYGGLAGVVVHLVGGMAMDGSVSWTGALVSSIIGMEYAAVMSAAMNVVGQLLRSRAPSEGSGSALLHALVQSVTVVASFGLATLLAEVLFDDWFSVAWEVMLIIAVVAFLAAFVGSSIAHHRQLRAAQRATYEARLQALRAQVHPHFLFNTLNTITALIRTRPAEAERVTEDLADLLRYSLRTSKRDAVSLQEEVEAVELYLSVAQARFRERLTTTITVPNDLRDARVPSMVLQPLVENAVKHGVGETEDPCSITVRAASETDTLRLCVTDTGPGFDTTDRDAVLHRGTGLANVQDRLRVLYGNRADFILHPQGVELRFPLQREDSGEA